MSTQYETQGIEVQTQTEEFVEIAEPKHTKPKLAVNGVLRET